MEEESKDIEEERIEYYRIRDKLIELMGSIGNISSVLKDTSDRLDLIFDEVKSRKRVFDEFAVNSKNTFVRQDLSDISKIIDEHIFKVSELADKAKSLVYGTDKLIRYLSDKSLFYEKLAKQAGL